MLTGCANSETENDVPSLQFKETSFDFGVIAQSGGTVSHDFQFVYKGDSPLSITGVPTSCACTSATVDPSILHPGNTGVVTVTFNPNLHAEPEGKFFKTVSFLTNPALAEIPEIKIWAEVKLDLGPEAFELQSDHNEEVEEHALTSYHSITPAEFETMRQNKDFTLVDVHIPEQAHIPSTDLFIPYNEIEHHLNELPQNKDAKIVLYCRSGGMSRAASSVLSEHGYTNVYDLVGGKNAYDRFIQK
ncbi:DUF1573 domain-containing protein [Candidatus Gracilibacteria bacterium]|nr:DUF1573 domain-containing protein [Candidatus Gracilibacteria bacterium]